MYTNNDRDCKFKKEMEKIEKIQREVIDSLQNECGTNKKLSSKLSYLNAMKTALENEYSDLERKRKASQRKLKSIKNSRSWKITSPIRKFIRLFKKEPSKVEHKDSLALKTMKSDFTEVKTVKILKEKLYSLGFKEKALIDLTDLFEQSTSLRIRNNATWELALWYAGQYEESAAEKALSYLSILKENTENKDMLQRIAIVEIECLKVLNRYNEAKKLLRLALPIQENSNLYLAATNVEIDVYDREKWINEVMVAWGISPISLKLEQGKEAFDCLKVVDVKSSYSKNYNTPKVTVIMPIYNAEKVIRTSLESILKQTWRNLQVIIVDDCSTDLTIPILEEYIALDNRVTLVKSTVNEGTYVCRNIGLKRAEGEFVTCQDADDWAHPEKIEKQVLHLINNNNIIANTSQTVRITEDLMVYRKGKIGYNLVPNQSSLLFRRDQVSSHVGYWDSVRFGADGEFVRRIKKVFGENSIVNLETGPLSLSRIAANSLTDNSTFGYNGYFFGARKEYVDSFSFYHESGLSLKYDFPQGKRPFPVPEPMKPERVALRERHFDVIIVSDFRLTGGTTSSNVEEIKAQRGAGLSTGLIQMSRYKGSGDRRINTKIRELIDGDKVQMLVYGEKVTCDVMIIRHPPVLQEFQQYIPEVKANRICVIVNQTPKVDYGENERIAYNILRCQEHLEQYFGQKGTWYPIGPLIRETLYKYHEEELQNIQLAEEDWVNIINVQEWARSKRPENNKEIRVGRHSRDQYVKWPSDRHQLLSIYPNSIEYEVRILGGAKVPEDILGILPDNWKVLEFGEIEPKEFLSELDVFVYYIHPDCVEAFGRVIIEAMACGVPVILPESYQQLFQDAAIYAVPEEVQGKIMRLMKSTNEYEHQSQKAKEYVNEKFSYLSHLRRIDLKGSE